MMKEERKGKGKEQRGWRRKKKRMFHLSLLFKVDQASNKNDWPNRVATTKHDKPICKAAPRYPADDHLPTKATSS